MAGAPIKAIIGLAAESGGELTRDAAFRAIYAAHKDRVFAMARRFTGDEALASDVAQEVFLKVFRRLGEFRGEAEITTWLYRIVANTCIDAERSRRRLMLLEGSGVTEQSSCTAPQDKQILRQQVNARVEAALAALKPKLRIALLLRYDGELSYEQIAEALGCSTGAVAARLSRGHRILAKKLEGLRGVLE